MRLRLPDALAYFQRALYIICFVNTLLNASRKSGISLKIDITTVKYHGNIIQPGTAEIDESKTMCLWEIRPPNTLTSLKTSFGFMNIFRRFISKYTEMVKPLYEIQKALAGKFLLPLGDEHFESIDKLIDAVLSL